MNQPQTGSHKKTIPGETLKQRVGSLFAELRLAAGWDRPSILLATYRSRLVLMEAQMALEKKLRRDNQSVYHLRVNEENFDIPVFMAQFPDRQKTVFFVEQINPAGEMTGANAFRALNIRRELLVDYSIRSVFWLSPFEAENLPVYAPDFWSFRHRMIEFLDKPTSRRVAALVEALAPSDWNLQELLVDTSSKIAIREELVRLIPDDWKNAGSLRAELFSMLGILYWAKGEYARSITWLKPALESAQKLGDLPLQSRCWVGLGLVLGSMKRSSEAETALLTATKLDRESASGWMNLGNLYREMSRFDEASSAYRKSVAINPKNAWTWDNLGDVMLAAGQRAEAEEAYWQSTRINLTEIHPWESLAQIYKSQGRLAQGLPVFKMICSLNADDGAAWQDLGLSYRAAGNAGSAIRAFYKAARRAPRDPRPWKNLGELYFSRNQLRYARKAYRTACLLDPNDESLVFALNSCYADRKPAQPGINNNI
jgi:tetratricopeptide (TPR) repeat protein